MVFKVFFFISVPPTLASLPPWVMLFNRSTALRDSATNIKKTSRKNSHQVRATNRSVVMRDAGDFFAVQWTSEHSWQVAIDCLWPRSMFQKNFFVFVAFLYHLNFQGCILSETPFSTVWMNSLPRATGASKFRHSEAAFFVLGRRRSSGRHIASKLKSHLGDYFQPRMNLDSIIVIHFIDFEQNQLLDEISTWWKIVQCEKWSAIGWIRTLKLRENLGECRRRTL